MSAGLDPRLHELLACPRCLAEFVITDTSLQCGGCRETFALEDGIPVLLPKTFDVEHLKEEQFLATMMREKAHLPAMRFNLEQWNQSKQDFWRMVAAGVSGSSKRFVNIGCGYDSRYSEFESKGHVFVNFDMVLDMLKTLRSDFGALFCVNGDLNSLPFKRGAFDYVISIDVIHHECDRLSEVLATFRDLLKPGGTLFLEDPNAWGLFQMAKSIFLPRPVYRYLRSTFHRLLRSTHRPADYEFPTNVWQVTRILQELGFEKIHVYPQTAYPTIGRTRHQIYRWLSGSEYVRTYHNYHYMLSATRSAHA